jgi:hypothetical protein
MLVAYSLFFIGSTEAGRVGAPRYTPAARDIHPTRCNGGLVHVPFNASAFGE